MSRQKWAQYAELASAPVTVTVQGSVCSAEDGGNISEYVIYAPPDFWHIEDGEHHLRYRANATGHYQYPAGGGPVACFQPRRRNWWSSGGMHSPALIAPRDLAHPEDDDFTRPVGPVDEVVYLDRPAWRVVLTPPARKPHPLVQILDVATGVVLAMESTAGDPILAFATIVTGADVPADTFTQPT